MTYLPVGGFGHDGVPVGDLDTMTYRLGVGHDDVDARGWGVVHSLALLSVAMPDTVVVLLLELVICHAAFGKLTPPERQCGV